MPPPAPKRSYGGVPMPFWFSAASAGAFRAMATRPDDVVLSSLPKAGTTWMHRVLHSLLHVYDDDGKRIPGSEGGVGASGQQYPDALPLDREHRRRLLEEGDAAIKFTRDHFGDVTFEELKGQPSPRLFSTHLFGMDMLPAQLLGIPTSDEVTDEGGEEREGRGRLIIVLRNLKDVLCSLHYFNGEARDGWLGNEHDVGSFNRFLAEPCTNSFGSSFDWIRAQERVAAHLRAQAEAFGTRPRVLVVYFEALKADLPAQLDRINSFLGLRPLTEARRAAVAEACGFKAMEGSNNVAKVTMRKGSVGDWRNHLDEETWKRFDDAFARRLGDCRLADPMRRFQWRHAPGMPPAGRDAWTLDVDPRTWPAFERSVLAEGMVTPDRLLSRGAGKNYERPPSIYRGVIPSETYEAEAGRYHLFIAGTCPWASSTAVARRLLGLEDAISMDVADGQSGAGWAFLGGASVEPWRGRPGPFWIHEAYQRDDPLVTSRITVPVLWDTKTNSIVSNESWDIIKILSTAFAGMGRPTPEAAALLAIDGEGRPTLIPDGGAELVESQHEALYNALLNGVYRAGLGFIISGGVESEAVLSARQGVYDKLAELDDSLSRHRFLLDDKLTAADVSLAMCLFRWDAAYRDAFALGGGRGGVLLGEGYPNLKSYLRDLYPVMEPLVDFRAIRQYFRIRQSADASFLRGNGNAQEGGNEYSCPLPNLREIIESAKGPAELSSRGIAV